MADYHEIPAEEMPDYVPDGYIDTDIYGYDDDTSDDVIADETVDNFQDGTENELDNIYGGWSLPRLFVLMLVLVIIAVVLIQLLVPAADQVLHPSPTPPLPPPRME